MFYILSFYKPCCSDTLDNLLQLTIVQLEIQAIFIPNIFIYIFPGKTRCWAQGFNESQLRSNQFDTPEFNPWLE